MKIRKQTIYLLLFFSCFFHQLIIGNIRRKLTQKDGQAGRSHDDKDQLTPLHRAAIWNRVKEAKHLLQDPAVKVDARDARGFTPLMYAESTTMARLLIKARAQVNAQNNGGETPLHRVVRLLNDRRLQGEKISTKEMRKLFKIIELLIAQGACVDIKNRDEKSVLDLVPPILKKIIERLVARYEKCSICCENYLENSWLCCLTCEHKFHIECIEEWLDIVKNKPRCPLCRQKAEIDISTIEI